MRLAALAVVTVALLAGCTPASPGSTSGTTDAATGAPTGSAGASIASKYYPVAEGNTWVYSIDYGTGSTVTDTEVMTSVVPEGDGARVTIQRTFVWDDGSQPQLVDTIDYVFAADGSLSVPFQSIPTAGGSTVTVKSGTMMWPSDAEFEAGTPKTGTIEATVVTSASTINEVVDFSIAGAGTEETTVPAGSYTARKLAQTLTISLPELGVEGLVITATTWLADGVGPVRTEVPDTMSGGATIVQVLKSFTPGG